MYGIGAKETFSCPKLLENLNLKVDASATSSLSPFGTYWLYKPD